MPGQPLRVLVILTALTTGIDTGCNAEPLSQAWVCIVESAAGSIWNESSKQFVPQAINFVEGHKKFTLQLSQPALNLPFTSQFCKQTISHWQAVIAAKGHLPYSTSTPMYSNSTDVTKNYDFSDNIGPSCFATTDLEWKFFDRDTPTRLHGYDFDPWAFQGLPGVWLELRGSRFFAGENLDGGPVVYTGTCNEIHIK